MKKGIGRFHVLTDYHFQQRFSHAEIALLAIEGGADTIQFRQKIGGVRHVLAAAIETADACRLHEIPVLVNDRVDVALASGADGVHLGQHDFPISLARSLLGPDAVIGGTATTLEQAYRVQEEGADYVGFGPVFPTGSKRNPAAVKGLSALAAVCASIDLPVIAIAGISADRVGSVMQAGAYGVAVMTQVSTAPAPAVAAREVRTALDAALDSASGRGLNGGTETRR